MQPSNNSTPSNGLFYTAVTIFSLMLVSSVGGIGYAYYMMNNLVGTPLFTAGVVFAGVSAVGLIALCGSALIDKHHEEQLILDQQKKINQMAAEQIITESELVEEATATMANIAAALADTVALNNEIQRDLEAQQEQPAKTFFGSASVIRKSLSDGQLSHRIIPSNDEPGSAEEAVNQSNAGVETLLQLKADQEAMLNRIKENRKKVEAETSEGLSKSY